MPAAAPADISFKMPAAAPADICFYVSQRGQCGGQPGKMRLGKDGTYSLYADWSSVNDVYPHDREWTQVGEYTMTQIPQKESELHVTLAPEKETFKDEPCTGESTTTVTVPEGWRVVIEKVGEKYEHAKK